MTDSTRSTTDDADQMLDAAVIAAPPIVSERLERAQLSITYPLKLLVVPAVVLLAQFMSAIIAEPNFINHDCAFLFHGAQLLMDGKKPFVDFVDMVPPLAFYSLIPLLILSKIVGLTIELTWSLTCFFTVILSVIAGIAITRNSTNMRLNDWLSLGPLFTSFLLLNLVFLYHTGQREFLFVIWFFLVFLCRWQRSLGNPVNPYIAAGAGVACALVSFIKPHVVAIVIALEFYWLLLAIVQFQKQRYMFRKAPEVVAGITTFLICFLLSCFIPNIDQYYSRWVPLVSQGYAAFNTTTINVLLFATIFGQLMGDRLLVGVVMISSIVMIRRSSLFAPLLVWTIAGSAIYLMQGKGWPYHSIPLVAGYVLVAGVLFGQLSIWLIEKLTKFVPQLSFLKSCFNEEVVLRGELFRSYGTSSPENGLPAVATSNEFRTARNRLAVLVFLVYGMVSLTTSGYLVHSSTASATSLATLDEVVERETKQGDNVLIIGTNFAAIYPLVIHTNRRQATRFMWAFPFPMLLYLQSGPNGGRWQAEMSRFIAEIGQDIEKTEPRLIAIEARCPWPLYQRLWDNNSIRRSLSRYEPIGESNGFAIFRSRSGVVPGKFIPATGGAHE